MKHSIVVPVHNEGPVVREYVRHFHSRLRGAIGDELHEIILVENGSRDNTLAECEALEAEFPETVRVLVNTCAGYGEAVRRGLREATGSHVSILEVDFLDPEFLLASRLVFAAERNALVIASKRHPLSVDARPWKRRMLTIGFNQILRLLFGYPGTDTHGLKSMETSLGRRLCDLAVTGGEAFQTEIVLIAWKLGVTIRETPIRIEERRATAVSIGRRAPRVWDSLFALRASLRRFRQ